MSVSLLIRQKVVSVVLVVLLSLQFAWGAPSPKGTTSLQAQQCAVEFYELGTASRQNIARAVPRADREGMTAYEKKMADVVEDLLYVDESSDGAFLKALLSVKQWETKDAWKLLTHEFPDVRSQTFGQKAIGSDVG